jgi:uncharacterized protein YaaN involved in tellurite resistance
MVVSNAGELTAANLTSDQQQQLSTIMEQINIQDSQAVITYGAGIQGKISSFAASSIENIRAKDSGYVGEMLTDLMLKVKDVNVDSLKGGGNFLSHIPLLGGIIDSVQKFIARYEKLSVEIEKITDGLENAKMTLFKDIAMYDTLYQKNLEYLDQLDLFILAGTLKLKEMNENVLPQLKAKAESSQDPVEAQNYNDVQQRVVRFEKKLDDLRRTRMISLQNAPQIRLIQGTNELLAEKIQTSILTTIPIWKNQIVIAIGLLRQKKALELQKQVTDTTNELLQKNSAMLKQGVVEVAKESERGLVEFETLKKVNSDLVSTIEETLRIQADGKAKRVEAEAELAKMEQELKTTLTTIR